MRSLFRAASATVAAFVLTAAASHGVHAQQAASSSFRIAFVNTAALLENAPGRVEAESTFSKETKGYSDELKKMSDSLNSAISSYQKVAPTLSATAKQTRETAIRGLEEQFQNRQQQLQQQAQQRQNELMAPIMERVKRVLDDIRTEDGYALIIAGDPNLILSYDKNLDITDRVVARLKTVSATTTPPKPGAALSAPAGVTRKPPTQ